MDRVSEALLTEFSKQHEITALPEETRFEHFAGYLAIQRHCVDTFDSGDIHTGGDDDTAIDAIGITVNDSLVTDVETLLEQADKIGSLDVTFILVQAQRSPNFDGTKISNLGYGAVDFFSETPKLKRNAKIKRAVDLMNALYERSSKFRPGNPICRLYYVTTGTWQDDENLKGRANSITEDLKALGLFRRVEFTPVDASRLQQLYRQATNAITKEFNFANKSLVPDVPGVKEAYLGFIPASEYLKIIQDDDGEIVGNLFSENPRDWLDYNLVNEEIKKTLESEARSRFVLMNNGVTIIAGTLKTTGNKFLIEDFSIVNGCQTSHVLSDQKLSIDETVIVPIRLIATQDAVVMNDIIRGTNRQTEVTAEQFYALQEFSKDLEAFCQAFPDEHKLYYERRTRQYHRLPIEKTRIVTPANMIKAYAAMFLTEPHRTVRSYAALKARFGTDIFAPGQKKEPYYTAAYMYYKLEFYFRNAKLDPKYKAARFHILLAARILSNPGQIPKVNSNEMERFCKGIMEMLWDADRLDKLIALAVGIIDEAAEDKYERDNVHTEAFTAKVRAKAEEAALKK